MIRNVRLCVLIASAWLAGAVMARGQGTCLGPNGERGIVVTRYDADGQVHRVCLIVSEKINITHTGPREDSPFNQGALTFWPYGPGAGGGGGPDVCEAQPWLYKCRKEWAKNSKGTDGTTNNTGSDNTGSDNTSGDDVTVTDEGTKTTEGRVWELKRPDDVWDPSRGCYTSLADLAAQQMQFGPALAAMTFDERFAAAMRKHALESDLRMAEARAEQKLWQEQMDLAVRALEEEARAKYEARLKTALVDSVSSGVRVENFKGRAAWQASHGMWDFADSKVAATFAKGAVKGGGALFFFLTTASAVGADDQMWRCQ